jgi:hypothetical protein
MKEQPDKNTIKNVLQTIFFFLMEGDVNMRKLNNAAHNNILFIIKIFNQVLKLLDIMLKDRGISFTFQNNF